VARSAFLEAAEQLMRALSQIATLPSTPALRRDEIRLQVALINPLMHVKGYPAPETKAAVERARRLIEQVETPAERPEDPLALYSVLYGVWSANYTMYNGAAIRELAGQFLELAVKDGTKIPLMVGHRLMASSGHFTRQAQSRQKSRSGVGERRVSYATFGGSYRTPTQ